MPLKACQTSEITAKSLGDTVFVVFFAMVWYVRQENCGTEPLPEGTERQGFRTVPAVSSMPICFALGAAEGKFSLRMNREATHAVTAKPVAKFLGLGGADPKWCRRAPLKTKKSKGEKGALAAETAALIAPKYDETTREPKYSACRPSIFSTMD